MKKRDVRILVVDDDRAVRSALRVNFQKAGLDVAVTRTAQEALERLRSQAFDVVLTDVRMPGMSGLELLEAIRSRHPETLVVVMTGYGNVNDAVTAIKQGATDYIIKPVSKTELLLILERALESRDLRNEVVALREQVGDRRGLDNMVGSTPPMLRLYEQVRSVAATNALVLLQGETGTGKEIVAQAIHQISPRRDAAFLRVNCAALPDTLLESELFGHERGAFTGAVRHHRGRFERAHEGTILLDEIGDISPAMQVKLLHVLEHGEFQRLGGQDSVRVDVRVIAATNRDLREEIRAGRFRKDLYYRLNVFSLELPPLRRRKDDIPALVTHFIRRYGRRTGKPVRDIAPAPLKQLMAHSWPGNVRELEHVVERAVILATGPMITHVEIHENPDAEPTRSPDLPRDLPPDPHRVLGSGQTLQEALENYEREIVVQALREAGGVQAQAARLLGLSRSNLHYRIRRLGIAIDEIRYR